MRFMLSRSKTERGISVLLTHRRRRRRLKRDGGKTSPVRTFPILRSATFLGLGYSPAHFRLSTSFKRISASTDKSIPSFHHFRPSPTLPFQRLLQDLGPEASTLSNIATLARTVAQFSSPSEAAAGSAMLFLNTGGPSESLSLDSHTMFHLFAPFCGDPENSSIGPVV